MTTQIRPSHPIITNTQHVLNICQPLFDLTGIELFVFMRLYDDNRTAILTTNHLLYQHFFEKGYGLTAPPPPHMIKERFHYIISDHGKYSQEYYDGVSLFNIRHPINFIKRYPGHYDMFFFANYSDKINLNEFYLNNIDLLEEFCCFFKEASSVLFRQSLKENLLITSSMEPPFRGLNELSILSEAKENLKRLQPFLCATKSKAVDKAFKANLTKKEILCLWLQAKGMSMLEISNHLHRSPKTIENHFANIKEKIDVNRKRDIIKFFVDSFGCFLHL